MENLISLKHINKQFGDVFALKDINFNVRKGEWLSIMGPSGSGKTTLINILSLMDNATDGSYELLGQDVTQITSAEQIRLRREIIGMIFQQFHLIPYLTALENVMLAQYYHSAINADDAKEMLNLVGLSHRFDHLPSQLSGGEQQRVCIARALINAPQILLADEPTGNLDEYSSDLIWALLRSARESWGASVVVVTHKLPSMLRYKYRHFEIKNGKINEVN